MEQINKIFTQMQNKLIKNVEQLNAYIIETDSTLKPSTAYNNQNNCNDSNESQEDNMVVTNNANIVKKKSKIKHYILFLILFTLFTCVLLNVYDTILDGENSRGLKGGLGIRNDILNIELSE